MQEARDERSSAHMSSHITLMTAGPKSLLIERYLDLFLYKIGNLQD